MKQNVETKKARQRRAFRQGDERSRVAKVTEVTAKKATLRAAGYRRDVETEEEPAPQTPKEEQGGWAFWLRYSRPLPEGVERFVSEPPTPGDENHEDRRTSGKIGLAVKC